MNVTALFMARTEKARRTWTQIQKKKCAFQWGNRLIKEHMQLYSNKSKYGESQKHLSQYAYFSLSLVGRELRTMLHETRDRQKFVSDVQYLRDMQHKVDSEYQVIAGARVAFGE